MLDFGWISQAIDTLTTQYGGVFLNEGHSWLRSIAIIILVTYALKWGLQAVSGHSGYDLPGLIAFFVMFCIASEMLAFYDQPLPGTSSTLASVIPDTADQLSAEMNNRALATTVAKFKQVRDNMEDPPSMIVNTSAWVVWVQTMLFMDLAEAFMFGVNIVGYEAVGVLVTVGPLSIPFFLVPRLSFIFWGWVQAIVEFSFWRVIATAIAYVWAMAWASFLDNAIHGDYSLSHFADLMPVMILLSIATIASLIYLPAKLTSDWFKGTASAGANWITTTALALRAAV